MYSQSLSLYQRHTRSAQDKYTVSREFHDCVCSHLSNAVAHASVRSALCPLSCACFFRGCPPSSRVEQRLSGVWTLSTPTSNHEEPGYGYGYTCIRALVLWPMSVFLDPQQPEQGASLSFGLHHRVAELLTQTLDDVGGKGR